MTRIRGGDFSKMSDWSPYMQKFHVEFKILGKEDEDEDYVYLYDSKDNLLFRSKYCRFYSNFDMSDFCIKAIKYFTRDISDEDKKDVEDLYMKKHLIKETFCNIFGVERLKKKQKNYETYEIDVSTQKNDLGFFVGHIYKKFGFVTTKKVHLLNDDVFQFLIDMFYTIECLTSSETAKKTPYPKTLSSYWYDDYFIFCNRFNPEASIRENVECEYYNQIYDILLKKLDPRKTGKRTHCYIDDLMVAANDNAYYIMEMLLYDPHFSIDEHNFVFYDPVDMNAFFGDEKVD